MHHEQLLPRFCPVQTARQFRKFQRLPAEIRNMIWEYALPEARVYEVLDAPNAKQKTPAQEGLMFANVHPEPPPALAAVCRESRYLVLHHYKPLTLGRTTKYVDMSRDILLLEPYLLVKRLHRTLHFMSQIPLVRDKATRLALGTSYGVYPGIFHPVLGRKVSKQNMGKLLASLAKFPRLKTLIFVVHQEFQFEFDFRFPGTLTPMANYSPSLMGAPSVLAGLGASTVYPPQLASSSSAPSTNTLLSSPYSGKATATTSTPIPSSRATTTTVDKTTASPSPLTFNASLPFQTTAAALPPPHATLPSLPSAMPAPAAPRPQQVHQAYRFKFDIESNINSPPRRPHTNELLYYPLDIKEDYDDDDNYYRGAYSCVSPAAAASLGSGSGSGLYCGGVAGGGTTAKRWEDCVLLDTDEDEEEDAEWCDPWPTNDDWRRFRRRWVRSMLAACAGHLNQGVEAEGQQQQQQHGGRAVHSKRCATPTEGKGNSSGPGKGGKARAVGLPTWKVKGASLLWRYARGVGPGESVKV
ncbi:uncharacterized protein B0T15DRAFT_46834 [Chaetomium strumarium]|uniref:2EXR domain-containing protein n=1 Tax=Chaetomium strumarium TaxID=1170767 RepID=A0AAJ0H2P3_9PEZI|nr:hypothetical protein B0T15DRAFT_46834 [Chaetomium strumarium]